MKGTILGVLLLVTRTAILVAQTQDPSIPSQKAAALEREVQELRAALAAQKEETQQLKQQLQQAVTAIEKLQQASSSSAESEEHDKAKESELTTEAYQGYSKATEQAENQGKAKESQLSFRIGGADFTPGGFVDITNVYRSTDVGSGTPTSFFSIPFSNSTAGSLSEDRISAQNSRLTLRVTDQVGKTDVTGYMEMDFNGNSANNLFINTNPSTARLRLFWVDAQHGKWEFLAGQTWGWLTPNRIGLSPNPPDIYNTLNVDNNYQVGLTYTRAPEFRVAYHLNDHWAFGAAIEDPEQFVGQSGEVTFPNAFSATLSSELDSGSLTSTPNKYPDFIAKAAYDTDLGGRHFHMEGAGLATTVQVAGTTGRHGDSSAGGGFEASVGIAPFPRLYLIGTGFYSDGGGRYIGGLGPDAVIKPDLGVSLVHSGSGTGGFEYQLTGDNTIAAYYGGAYFQRNFYSDTTSGAKPGTLEGFGFPQSSNAANRALQEATIDFLHTFWRNPNRGALQLLTQYSYVTRSPWFVPAGAPKNAHLGMGYANIRYVIP